MPRLLGLRDQRPVEPCGVLERIGRLLDEGARCLRYLAAREAGDIAHDFYNAMKHFFDRVAVEMNRACPRERTITHSFSAA